MKTAGEFRESTAPGSLAPPLPPAPGRAIRLVDTAYPSEPGVDTALSRALLLRVDGSEQPESLRLYRPGRLVAFGRRDVVGPGYGAAVAAARRAGFAAVERLAGGRAAVFHSGTVAFAWSIPDPDPPSRTRARYEEVAGLNAAALCRLGLDARVGELPGEYCPGEYSINVGGVAKVMGVGQRLTRHAAHVGGVIVVGGAEALRTVLEPVYAALGIDWDPATAGALDQFVPGLDVAAVVTALREEFGAAFRLYPGAPDEATLTLARRLAPEHLAP